MKVFFLFLLFLVNACTVSESTPEAALEAVVQYSFSKGQSREGLLNRTTGSLYDQYAALSDDELEQAIKVDQLGFKKIEIQKNSCTEERCSLTYIIKYDASKNSNASSNVEVKKIAELVKIEGKWKVSNITGIKTYVEMKTPIEL